MLKINDATSRQGAGVFVTITKPSKVDRLARHNPKPSTPRGLRRAARRAEEARLLYVAATRTAPCGRTEIPKTDG